MLRGGNQGVHICIEMEGQGITAINKVGLTKIVEVFEGDRGLVKQKEEIMMAPYLLIWTAGDRDGDPTY